MKKIFFSTLVFVLVACSSQPVDTGSLPSTAILTSPVPPSPTLTLTATPIVPKGPAGYGQLPKEVTPTSGVITTPATLVTLESLSDLEPFIPPTAEDAIVNKGEHNLIPDYAQSRYDSMVTIPMLRKVAEDCKVYQKDITVHYVQNKLGDPLAMWTLIYTTPNGVCWSTVESTNQLAKYPTYWKPGTNEVMGALQPSAQNDGIGWKLIDGEMIWLGTVPGMLNGIGSMVLNGENLDVYSSYIIPAGISVDDISKKENWILIDQVVAAPELPQFFLDVGISRENLKNFAIQEDGSIIDKRDGSIAYDVYHKLVSVKYGNWVLDPSGKLMPGDVSIDSLSCIQEGTSCIKDEEDINLDSAIVHLVQALSTGAFERTIIYGPGTQEVWGIGDIIWMKTENGEFPLLVTFEDKDKKNYNLLYEKMSVWVIGGVSANFPKEMLTPIEVENALPSGFNIKLGFIQAENATVKRFAQYEEVPKFWNRFNNDTYIEKVNAYFGSLKAGAPATFELDYLFSVTNTRW